MSIEEINKSYQKFICTAISAKYNDFEETDINPALEELLETLNKYKIKLNETKENEDEKHNNSTQRL